MNLESLNLHLCALVSEDITAHERLYVTLDEQEHAVAAHDADTVDATTQRVGELLEASAQRAAKRTRLLQGFAEHFSVAGGAVTLGSIAARLGDDGQRLAELRLELRDLVERVQQKNRRVSALISMHRHVTNEILETVLADETGNPVHERGVLLDAEV